MGWKEAFEGCASLVMTVGLVAVLLAFFGVFDAVTDWIAAWRRRQ